MVISNKPKSPKQSKPKATPEVPVDPQAGGDKPQELSCSFCGRDKWEVEFLVAGLNAYICGQCIDYCRDIVGAERVRKQEIADAKH